MDSKKNGIHLYQWIWNSYKSTALVPIIIIGVVFIGIFIATNLWTMNNTKDFLIEDSKNELHQQIDKEIMVIQEQLNGISYIVDMYKRINEKAIASSRIEVRIEDQDRFAFSEEGVYYSASDATDGGAAVFYSGYYPIGTKEVEKVSKLLNTQSFMKDAYESHPLIEQIYINTFDSLNVIYPYFDVISQYAAHMDIPSYNFYYLADELHNPKKQIIWTEAYLDPAGLGWMASAIAPVYQGDFLEGVAGVDITVSTITKELLEMALPYGGYGILVGSDGTILALPEMAEQDWGLSELTVHTYEEAIMEDTYKPEEYNLYNIDETKELADIVYNDTNGVDTLRLNNKDFIVSWGTITETRWKLLVMVEEDAVFADVYQMANRLLYVGLAILAILILFLLLFFRLLMKRARKVSVSITTPLLDINTLLSKIEHGEYYHDPLKFSVIELNETAMYLQQMGNALGDATARLNRFIDSEKIAKEEAEKASLAKSQFLSSMSHELRTPLNAILGFSQVLEMDTQEPLTANQSVSIKYINSAGQHLLELVNDVLDLSKIEAGKISVYIEAVLIKEVVRETFSLMEPVAKEKGIEMLYEVNELDNKYIYGDPTRIKQVLINLISNAIKYNRENGSVELIVREINHNIRFIVKDTGMGISTEKQKRIFEPFTRVHETSKAIEGTGIGLSISKHLIEMMAGALELESEFGKGSQFWFELPICDEKNLIVDSFDSLDRRPLGNLEKEYTILYVEDNVSNVNLITHIFKGFSNINLVSASLGSVGIEIATTQSIDLILLDINLPDMTGFEYYNRIKASENCIDIPIVALSANASTRDIIKAKSIGFYDYLTKPIDIKQFVGILVKIFEEKESK